MIQIQDNSINQSVAPTSQAPMANVPTSLNLSQPATSSAPADNKAKNEDRAAEIDNLLAELDRLSKNMEEKPAARPETVSETVPSDDKKSEKFDFDSFLTDLETKIDAESKNNQPKDDQKSDQSTTDFRKNRSVTDVQSKEEEEEVKDALVSESNSESSDQTRLTSKENTEEDLKAQNIFEMLGLMEMSDDEKSQFLDELEAMIWDDFVIHDLELLLTSEEYVGARKIIDDQNQKDEEKKENLIIYLEKLVPDLDEVLYDKALELKSEMMGERLMKMKENANESTLSKIKEAEKMISQNLWKSATLLLNQLS